MSIRPWQHVLESLHGYLTLANRLLQPSADDFCEGWNFGPDEPQSWTVEQVVQAFCHVWGEGEYVAEPLHGGGHEARMLRLDVTKARTRLGWSPKWGVAKAVEQTAKWYKSFAKGAAPMTNVCLADLHEYLEA
jgi:CDP-glucose 4,6-dehydratase